MAFEQIGLEAVLEGVADFIGGGEAVNASVSAMSSGLDLGAGIIGAAGDAIGGALSAMADLALSAASAAGAALIDFFSDSFAGALEAEQTIARLGQVIESTGGIAGVTIGEAEALADEFKHLAGGSDDAVLSIIDMGLRMGTIGEEEMPAFIQTTLDLGTVMSDAGKAAQLMARAQEDPVGVLGALRKAGILVNETTEAQIKAMVASGDTAGAYAILMDRVGEATAGAAETMAGTASGQWAIFTETIADAGESIMMAFLPALNGILSSLTPLIPIVDMVAGSIATFFETVLAGGDVGLAFDNLAGAVYRAFGPEAGLMVMQFGDFIMGIYDFVVANWPLMQATFTTVFTAIQGVLTVLSDFVTLTLMPALATIWDQTNIQLPTAQATFESVMAGIVVATQVVSDFITNVLVPVMTAAVDWVVANWPAIQATAIEVWTQVQTAINTAVVFIQGLLDAFLPQITTNVQTTLSGLTAFWDEHGAAIMAIVQTNFENMAAFISVTLGIIGVTVSTTLTLLSGLFATTMQLINGDWTGAWTTIKSTITAALDGILALVGQDLASFTGIWTSNWEMAVTILTAAWDSIIAAIFSAGISIISTLNTLVGNMLAAFDIPWANIGISIITNIGNGIASAAGTLAQQAADAAYSAYQAMLDALGIHSPSDQLVAIGEQFNTDVARGIADTSIVAVRETEHTAQDMVRSMVGTFERARPVLVDSTRDIVMDVVDTFERARPVLVQAADNMLGVIERQMNVGLNLDPLCQKLAVTARRIGEECISGSLSQGLGISFDPLIDDLRGAANDICRAVEDVIDPFQGGAIGVDDMIGGTPGANDVRVDPVGTGGIPAGNDWTRTGNTYQYAPTYGGTPVSPERDFAMMQVLAWDG